MFGLIWTANQDLESGSIFNEIGTFDYLQTNKNSLLHFNQENYSVSRDLQDHLEEEEIATTGCVAQYARVNIITGKLKTERRYQVTSTFDLYVKLPDEMFGDYNFGGLGFFSLEIIEITISKQGFRRMSKKRSLLPIEIGNADEGYKNEEQNTEKELDAPRIGDLIRVKIGDNDGWWEITNVEVNFSVVYSVKSYSCSVVKAKNKRYENFDIPYFTDKTDLNDEPVARVDGQIVDSGKTEPQIRPVYIGAAGSNNNDKAFWNEW